MNVAASTQRVPHYPPMDDVRAKMIARSPEQELRVFEYSLHFMHRVFGKRLFPGDSKTSVGTLNVLGVLNGRWTGYKCRCNFPGQEIILQNINDQLEATGFRRRFGISGIKVPVSDTLFVRRVFPEDVHIFACTAWCCYHLGGSITGQYDLLTAASDRSPDPIPKTFKMWALLVEPRDLSEFQTSFIGTKVC